MNKRLLFTGILLFASVRGFSQCAVIVSNFPHGDCEGTDIELFAAASGNFSSVTYQWTGPNGFSSTNAFVYITQAPAACSGVYSVTITTDLGCSASGQATVNKHPNPQVYTLGDQSGCLNTTSPLFAADGAGSYGPYAYLWDTGQTTESIEVMHNGSSYPAPGCTITNAYGCSAANTSTFFINTLPSPGPVTIEESGATTFCEGQQVVLISDGDNSLSFQWMRHSHEVTYKGNGANYKAKKSGNYRLVATNVFGCAVVSNAINVTVLPKPEAYVTNLGSSAFCDGDSTLLEANAGPYTYQWKRYGNEIAGATGPQVYANKAGNYRVVVTDQYGCHRESLSEKITVNCRETAAPDVAELSVRPAVYPNPSSGEFHIGGTGFEGPADVRVTDVAGRVILDLKSRHLPLAFGNELGAGSYLVSVLKNGEQYTQRIMKTH